ncbi:MAG: hypothetical protein SGPRY_008135, partial [Prymnesium sp.]
VLATEKARREKRANDNKECTEYQLHQMREIARARRREREDEVRARHEIAAAAKKDEETAARAKEDYRARGLKQQMLLVDQMEEREANQTHDPDSATMTPLEALMNRSLLVSMAQHSYDDVSVLT